MDLNSIRALIPPTDINLIVAINSHGCIGKDNALPWRCRSDLAHFKDTTLNGTLIMGRKTYESIGRPLPNRNTIVVTRDTTYTPENDDVDVVHSIDEAFTVARMYDAHVFIAGGEEIYKLALPYCDRLIISNVMDGTEGDAHFILPDPKEWVLVREKQLIPKDEDPACVVYVLEQKEAVEEAIAKIKNNCK